MVTPYSKIHISSVMMLMLFQRLYIICCFFFCFQKEETNNTTRLTFAFSLPRSKRYTMRIYAEGGKDDFVDTNKNFNDIDFDDNEYDVLLNYGRGNKYFFVDEDDEDDDDVDERDDSSSILEMDEDELYHLKNNKLADTKFVTTTTNISISLDIQNCTNNIVYFYFQNELGMSQDDMWKITNEDTQVLGYTADVIRGKVATIRSLLKISEEEVKYMITRHTGFLQLSVESNLIPTLEYLRQSLNYTSIPKMKSMLLENPSILCYSLQNLETKLSFFRNQCGFNDDTDKLRKWIASEPKLMRCGVRTGLIPKYRYYTDSDKLNIPQNDFHNMIHKNPSLLLYSIHTNIHPKISYLGTILGMTLEEIRRLLVKYPPFLDYSLENKLIPLTAYYCSSEDDDDDDDDFYGSEGLQFTCSEFVSILLRFPRLITYSLSQKINYFVRYLRKEYKGMSIKEIKGIVYEAPQLVSLNIETNIQSKFEYLLTEDWFPFWTANTEIRRVFIAYPSFPTLSIENTIQPKLEYLLQAIIRSEKKKKCNKDGKTKTDSTDIILEEEEVNTAKSILSDMILARPKLFSYSLEKRIRPRMERILQHSELSPSLLVIGITMKEDRFDKWLQGHVHRQLATDNEEFVLLQKRAAAVAKQQRPSPPVKEGIIIKNSTNDGRIMHWTRPRRSIQQR